VTLVTSGIRAMAEQRGQPSLYHDTLTRAWVYAVAAVDGLDPSIATFDRFLDVNPTLLDTTYLLRHYSAQRLSSPAARARWLSPDREPIAAAPSDEGEPPEQDTAIQAVPLPEFRQVLENVPLPVSIMTAHDATLVHGVTLSSVANVARDPAMLVACVHRESRILPIMRASGGFAISYLGTEQRALAARFADPARGESRAQFHGVPHALGPFGAPIVTGGPAWFECRLAGELRVNDHQVVCGTVVAAGTTDVQPLQRFRGAWM
jgi:flavin reductase (DIM6/NTAB) family NADH-FMN oxidoreductase RutF